ncbi:hypothetical protein L228DRAFT_87952 [Xylona heveae TC161]|uniref:RGS domain-containing protein n=1 Tax=Xylona heveae (strain CBS 132557 / TC161) TaxID=1328760 RepID=A0A165HXK9_XYLHT|nr:hypothetical protein L228DRAFT_87952 [Xylona heveae TC161]KZF24068.1 hypothetical protein L228DRAFT_87952 [Xylona heveae TC161]
MAVALFRRSGHNWGPPNLDAIGAVYITVCIVWTLLFAAGLITLLHFRKLPFIRMRDMTLVASALVTLHVYLLLDLLVYPLNGAFPCGLEFWIMGIYLPLGFALFQAQNMQLLSLSLQQKRLSWQPRDLSAHDDARSIYSIRSLRKKWNAMTFLHRMYSGIAIGACVQVVVTSFLFFGSRKFHGSYGAFSADVNPAKCRKGWEWLPSIVWQFVWTYGIGPYVLFKIRNIRDVYHWSLQTKLSIILSLPGTPLWIAAIYSDKFANVDLWWPAPMWFAPGLMGLEFLTIFFPLWEAYRTKDRRHSAQSAFDGWEKDRSDVESIDCASTKQSVNISVSPSATSSERKRRHDIYGMQALEKTLDTNAAGLFKFAATKEFTGENIVFLTQVRDWRRNYLQLLSDGAISVENRRKMYAEGVKIFYHNVCMKTSEFPVNIESKIYADLQRMFHSSNIPAPKAVVAPFADDAVPLSWTQPKNANSIHSDNEELITIASLDSNGGSWEIPDGFDEHAFDRAEASVKYMVFTNTWIRFVDAQETASMASTQGSGSSRSSTSLMRWLKMA